MIGAGKKRDGSDEPSGLAVVNLEFDIDTMQVVAFRWPTPAASLKKHL
jgi:hypothetical protein